MTTANAGTRREPGRRAGRCARLALGMGTLMALASLTLVAGRALASGSVSVRGEVRVGDVRIGGHVENLVPVPRDGVRVSLWSEPGSGSVVRTGERVRLYLNASTDCSVTVLSVDTQGRVRLLYPGPGGDGWVRGGRTYRLPEPGSRYDLRVAGPPGVEYVFALVSLYPVGPRYPAWLTDGRVWGPGPWTWNAGADLYRTGWVIGDPFYQVRRFCERLVPDPTLYDTYFTAWVSYQVGSGYDHPRTLCADCHGFHSPDPYGPACSVVRIKLGGRTHAGWIDFRIAYQPRFVYEVREPWRQRYSRRPDHPDAHPDGRWRWSTEDRDRSWGGIFRDARSDRDRGGQPDGRRERDAAPGKPDTPEHRERYAWSRDPASRPPGAGNGERDEARNEDRDRSRQVDRDRSGQVDRDRPGQPGRDKPGQLDRSEPEGSRGTDGSSVRERGAPQDGDREIRSRDRTPAAPRSGPSEDRPSVPETTRARERDRNTQPRAVEPERKNEEPAKIAREKESDSGGKRTQSPVSDKPSRSRSGDPRSDSPSRSRSGNPRGR